MSSLDVKTSLDGLAVLAARVVAGHSGLDKVVEGVKLAGWLILTLPSVFSMLQQPAARLMEGIVDKVVEGYKLAGLAQQLALRGYHVLSLMKLRMLHVALCAAVAGSMSLLPILSLLPSLPALPPHVSIPGSMLPFALRWLAAELPHRMGNPALTLERLCTLQAYCTAKVGAVCNPTAWAIQLSHWSDYALCRHTAQHS
ncbi:unnamed protein product [Closterium sp. Naga37s-1]|nr:unnamed protein product [Closterium sp. Naga37s-1]